MNGIMWCLVGDPLVDQEGSARLLEEHTDSTEETSLRQIGIDESDIRRITKAGGYRHLVREGDIRPEYLDLFDEIVKGRRALITAELSNSKWSKQSENHYKRHIANKTIWDAWIKVELQSMPAQTPYHDAYLRCLVSEAPVLGEEVLTILRDDWLTASPTQFVAEIEEHAERVACIRIGSAIFDLAIKVGPHIPIGCKRAGAELIELVRMVGSPRKAMLLQTYLNAWPEITVVREKTNVVRLTLDRPDVVVTECGRMRSRIIGDAPGLLVGITPLADEDEFNIQIGPHPETWLKTPTLDPQ